MAENKNKEIRIVLNDKQQKKFETRGKHIRFFGSNQSGRHGKGAAKTALTGV